MVMVSERYWTVEEIATRLNMSEETVRIWIRSGELKAVTFGRRAGYRITDEELIRFLKARGQA